jgi:hypothetical protein
MLSLFLSANIFATILSKADNDWPATTKTDLQFIQSKIQATVPYTFIQSSTAFQKQLHEGFIRAISASSKVANYIQYKHVLENYIDGFQLEHISIHFFADKAKTQHKQIEVKPFFKDSVWVSITSFQTTKNAALIKQFQSLIKSMPQYRKKKLIVFDLRQNGGGSSEYSRPIIVALYSPEFLRSLGQHFIWNQPWVKLISLNEQTIKRIHNASMLNAYKNGERLYEMVFWPVEYGQTVPLKKKIVNPVKATVVILSDMHCGSMCYQFVRTLTQLPNTVLVGQAPDIMDRITVPISFDLPSKLGSVAIATEEIVCPAYAFGQKITPKYLYSGDITDTSKVERWISHQFLT